MDTRDVKVMVSREIRLRAMLQSSLPLGAPLFDQFETAATAKVRLFDVRTRPQQVVTSERYRFILDALIPLSIFLLK
jgi:hypothetical protein